MMLGLGRRGLSKYTRIIEMKSTADYFHGNRRERSKQPRNNFVLRLLIEFVDRVDVVRGDYEKSPFTWYICIR